nr:DUF1983 domain-containing protein [Providencia stuartii]
MAKVEVDHQGNALSIISYKAAVMYNGQSYDAAMLVGAGVKDGQVVTQIGFSADTFGIFNPVSGKLEPVFLLKKDKLLSVKRLSEMQQSQVQKSLMCCNQLILAMLKNRVSAEYAYRGGKEIWKRHARLLDRNQYTQTAVQP